jgi:uncharacterized GH25 family protein
MKWKMLILGLLLAVVVVSVSAHDLFLKFDAYFLPPHSQTAVRLMNGTFQKSENPIRRERLLDVSLVTPDGGRLHPPMAQWRDEGEESLLDLQTTGSGTYVVGVALTPRNIELKAAEFNKYLEHDGIPDTLAQRQRDGQMNQDVRERYAKFAKAILQVGGTRTDHFQTHLGYPVEIVPKQNPYSLKVGQPIELLCLKDGRPISNQFMMAGCETRDGTMVSLQARADAEGVVRLELKSAGRWYAKFINMVPLNEPGLNYESKWASLTFEIR